MSQDGVTWWTSLTLVKSILVSSQSNELDGRGRTSIVSDGAQLETSSQYRSETSVKPVKTLRNYYPPLLCLQT